LGEAFLESFTMNIGEESSEASDKITTRIFIVEEKRPT